MMVVEATQSSVADGYSTLVAKGLRNDWSLLRRYS